MADHVRFGSYLFIIDCMQALIFRDPSRKAEDPSDKSGCVCHRHHAGEPKHACKAYVKHGSDSQLDSSEEMVTDPEELMNADE